MIIFPSRNRSIPSKSESESEPEPKPAPAEPEPEQPDFLGKMEQILFSVSTEEEESKSPAPTANKSEKLKAAFDANGQDELKNNVTVESRDDLQHPSRESSQGKVKKVKKVKGSHSDLIKAVKKHGEMKQKQEKVEKELLKYEKTLSQIEQDKAKAVKKIKALSNKFDLTAKYDLAEAMDDHIGDESVEVETAQADESVSEVQQKSVPAPTQKVKGSHSDWAKEIKKVHKLDQQKTKVENEINKCKMHISAIEQQRLKKMEYIKALSAKFDMDDFDV